MQWRHLSSKDLKLNESWWEVSFGLRPIYHSEIKFCVRIKIQYILTATNTRLSCMQCGCGAGGLVVDRSGACWCSWYLKVLTQLTASRSWAFCYNLDCLCSPSVQRHCDWGLMCLFIYLTTIFDCVSCVASNNNMKMHAEKGRLLEECLKSHTSIYLEGLRRVSATSQDCWHRNRESNSGLLGTTVRLWPTAVFFKCFSLLRTEFLCCPNTNGELSRLD